MISIFPNNKTCLSMLPNIQNRLLHIILDTFGKDKTNIFFRATTFSICHFLDYKKRIVLIGGEACKVVNLFTSKMQNGLKVEEKISRFKKYDSLLLMISLKSIFFCDIQDVNLTIFRTISFQTSLKTFIIIENVYLTNSAEKTPHLLLGGEYYDHLKLICLN